MGDDFSKHPPSVGEMKSDIVGDARYWTPRDALISLLRDIDSGKTTITDIAIVYREEDAEKMRIAALERENAYKERRRAVYEDDDDGVRIKQLLAGQQDAHAFIGMLAMAMTDIS